jgi:hypothetical protein
LEIANLKSQVAALDIDLQEANDAIDKLNVELTAANNTAQGLSSGLASRDARITTLEGRLKTIETTAGLP